MAKLILISLIIVLISGPAWASQPGHPLDCSDWVILESGFSCEPYVPWPCAPDDPRCVQIGLSGFQPDNEGYFYELRAEPNAAPPCTPGGVPLYEVRLVRVDAHLDETLVAYIRDRCNVSQRDTSETCTGNTGQYPHCLFFDPVAGRMLIKTRNTRSDTNTQGDQVFALRGFTTLYEIAQSYTPQPLHVAYRVPIHPEGLRAADHFDTYWGRVSDLPDFTQAHAMACSYPVTPPHAGDYIILPDNSPVPAPGAVNYTVTAVTNGADTRYGRKRIGGVMSGRDPELLPACPAATTAKLSSGPPDVVP